MPRGERAQNRWRHLLWVGLWFDLMSCISFLPTLSSCTQERPSSAPPSNLTSSESFQGGHPALSFDYLETNEILFSKLDPINGDWSTRIVRKSHGTDPNGSNSAWIITLAPNGRTLQDHRANAAFILHLLDTIHTLQFKAAGLSGPPESFGLARPFYSLRWKLGNDSSAKEYRLDLGDAAKTNDGTPEGLYARIGASGDAPIFIVNGALLQMLTMIRDFSAFRLSTLATFDSDEMDEIQISAKSHRPCYAQRDGDHWADRSHRPIRVDVQTFLDQLTHLRILQFIDEPEKAKILLAKIHAHPLSQLKFSGRKSEPVTVELSEDQQKAYATVSSRKSEDTSSLAVFEVYPEALNWVAELLRGCSKTQPLKQL